MAASHSCPPLVTANCDSDAFRSGHRDISLLHRVATHLDKQVVLPTSTCPLEIHARHKLQTHESSHHTHIHARVPLIDPRSRPNDRSRPISPSVRRPRRPVPARGSLQVHANGDSLRVWWVKGPKGAPGEAPAQQLHWVGHEEEGRGAWLTAMAVPADSAFTIALVHVHSPTPLAPVGSSFNRDQDLLSSMVSGTLV